MAAPGPAPTAPALPVTGAKDPASCSREELHLFAPPQIDICAICRNPYSEPCIQCQAEDGETKCCISVGECDHMYHTHCIELWLESRSQCPLDNRDWKFATQDKKTSFDDDALTKAAAK
mmetsp:Transcript_97393/g.145964  ORF Transcript_97393/g.145964 Transcript_97393/m.145964 type:complete len:119 (-) Transcript_97393:19-375(-)